MLLQDKVAVVLGASAELGTGWAIAERFAAEGAKLVVAARRAEPLAKLAERTGGTAVSCDASDPAQVEALGDLAISTFGRLDVAVNAAGAPVGGTIENTPHDDLVRSIETNFYGSVYFVRQMAARMGQGGSIILFSSMAAAQPLEYVYAYACAKAAADCLVRYAAIEYGGRGIKVNSIQPGAIRSEMSQAMWGVPGMTESWAGEVPLGRIGQPADFADAALWLAGPSFVSGLNLPVSGGNQLTRFPRAAERPPLDGIDPTSGA